MKNSSQSTGKMVHMGSAGKNYATLPCEGFQIATKLEYHL